MLGFILVFWVYSTVQSAADQPQIQVYCTVRSVHLYRLQELINCVLFSFYCTLTTRYTVHSKH